MGLISLKECRTCQFYTMRTTSCDFMTITGTSKARTRKDGKAPKCQDGKVCAFYDPREKKMRGKNQKPIPKDEDIIRAFRENRKLTNPEIAKKLGTSNGTINAALKRLGLVRENIFALKDRSTGELLFEGTAKQCAAYAGYTVQAIHAAARGRQTMKKFDCERGV